MATSRIVTVLTLLVLTAGHAIADVRVALVVANAAYENARLENPTKDAELIRQALERMEFDVSVVTDADLVTFAVTLESFYAKAQGADLALFYFAGHGFAVGGELVPQNYLMSVSADVTSTLDTIIRSGGIELDEVIASVSKAAKVSLVFIDVGTCRNDPRVTRGGNSGRGLVRLADVATKSTFVGLSTRLGDLAEDGAPGVGSPFARAFAEHMPTPGLRLDDAFRRVRQAVIQETAGGQRPEARDDLDDALVVVGLEQALQVTMDEVENSDVGGVDAPLPRPLPESDSFVTSLFAPDPLAGTLLRPLRPGVDESEEQTTVMRITCQNFRREYLVSFDASSQSFVTSAEEGPTAYEVTEVKRDGSNYVVRGHTPNGRPDFVAQVGANPRIDFFVEGELFQTDQCR